MQLCAPDDVRVPQLQQRRKLSVADEAVHVLRVLRLLHAVEAQHHARRSVAAALAAAIGCCCASSGDGNQRKDLECLAAVALLRW